MKQVTLDSIDLQLLDQLQNDASLSNQALAERLHMSPPTSLRRVKRLREAGPYAVPALVGELRKSSASGSDRSALAAALGRLDRSSVPAWSAVLDAAANDAPLAAAAAEILGRIGDPAESRISQAHADGAAKLRLELADEVRRRALVPGPHAGQQVGRFRTPTPFRLRSRRISHR